MTPGSSPPKEGRSLFGRLRGLSRGLLDGHSPVLLRRPQGDSPGAHRSQPVHVADDGISYSANVSPASAAAAISSSAATADQLDSDGHSADYSSHCSAADGDIPLGAWLGEPEARAIPSPSALPDVDLPSPRLSANLDLPPPTPPARAPPLPPQPQPTAATAPPPPPNTLRSGVPSASQVPRDSLDGMTARDQGLRRDFWPVLPDSAEVAGRRAYEAHLLELRLALGARQYNQLKSEYDHDPRHWDPDGAPPADVLLRPGVVQLRAGGRALYTRGFSERGASWGHARR